MKQKIWFGLIATLVLIILSASVSATSRTYTNADIVIRSTGYTNNGINGTHHSQWTEPLCVDR